jgi:hypothetical protein
MIERLPEPASNILAVKVSGKLQHEDFGQLLAWVEAAVAGQGKSRMLIVFGDFHGWDLHAFWDDIKFHATCDAVERIAYVGDQAWEKALVYLARPFTKTTIRYFDTAAIDAARGWLGEA